MMKKILALAGAGALLLSVAGPAFGCTGLWCLFCRDVNNADVENNAQATAYTGWNSQSDLADVEHGGGVTVNSTGDRDIHTGNADAYAGALVVANTNVSCCDGDSCWCLETNNARVRNGAGAMADSGLNYQDDMARVLHGGGVTVNGGDGSRVIHTGNADSEARAWTIVNTRLGF